MINWRRLTAQGRRNLAREIGERAEHRLLWGMRTYGQSFVGDPVEEAKEEALDLQNYLCWIERQREAHIQRIHDLEDALSLAAPTHPLIQQRMFGDEEGG